MKTFNRAYVALNIFVDGVEQLIENIIASTFITFTDEKITVKCKSHIMPRALLDNGPSLNVILMSTLSRLPIDLSYMKKVI